MATKNKYNGKYNWETWAAGLWIDNNERLYNKVNNIVATNSVFQAEQLLKDLFEEELNPIVDRCDLYSQLLRGALSEIYWPEIIDNIREETKEMLAV